MCCSCKPKMGLTKISAVLSLVVVLLTCISSGTASSPPPTFLQSKYSHIEGVGSFYPGWGFAKRVNGAGLGYPTIPLEGYPTYDLAKSTSAYFLGNDTGLNSQAELEAQSKFGIVGIGWQIHMRGAAWRHLEQWEVETAKQLKAIDPTTKVLVSRNSEVATVVWDAVRPLLVPPGPDQHPHLWVREPVTNKVANGSWLCDNCGLPPAPSSIPYGKLYFNWTDDGLRQWWLNTHIMAGVAESSIDGVYFDCCCGAPMGVPRAALPAFMAAAQSGFDTHLPALAAAKKMTIAWNGEHVNQKSCAADMKRLLEIYGSAAAATSANNQTFQLIYNNVPKDLLPTVAAFLIIRGPHALLQYTVIGPYECASEPCGTHNSPQGGYGPYYWNASILERDYGEPTGDAVGDATSGVWKRTYTKATVKLDCSSWQATITTSDAKTEAVAEK